MLMLIGATKIDRVVAVLAGIMQPHAAAAAATRRHAAMARLAVVPAPGSWPLENGASPPWRCAARETWRTNGAAALALLHRDLSQSGHRDHTPARQAAAPSARRAPPSAARL